MAESGGNACKLMPVPVDFHEGPIDEAAGAEIGFHDRPQFRFRGGGGGGSISSSAQMAPTPTAGYRF
jgi:hypothetical protein